MFSFCDFAELFFLLCWRLFSSPVLTFLWFSGLFRVSARFFPLPLSTVLIPIVLASRTWMFFIFFSWLGSIPPSKILTVPVSMSVLIFRERISPLPFLFGISMITCQIHACFLVSVMHSSAACSGWRAPEGRMVLEAGCWSQMTRSSPHLGHGFTFTLLGPRVLLCKIEILPTSNTTESDSD